MAEAGSAASPRKKNHAAWLGPLIAIPGFLSYYTVFYMYPVLRDFPWLNLLILGGAVALSVAAVRRATPGWGRFGSIAGLFVSAGLLTLLSFYCFVLSYGVPDPNRVVADGTRLPPITLASWDGTQIDVAAASRDTLILVFYRGHW